MQRPLEIEAEPAALDVDVVRHQIRFASGDRLGRSTTTSPSASLYASGAPRRRCTLIRSSPADRARWTPSASWSLSRAYGTHATTRPSANLQRAQIENHFPHATIAFFDSATHPLGDPALLVP